jgi:secondary thiamine-phosphate synthase enzyme
MPLRKVDRSGTVVTIPWMEPGGARRLTVQTGAQAQALDITDQVSAFVNESGLRDGLCTVYVPHTTAGVFINENADPNALLDVLSTLERMVPWEGSYRHAEGNAAAHIKAILVGSSKVIPVIGGRLSLGRWQGIFFAEFDGPREREVLLSLLG